MKISVVTVAYESVETIGDTLASVRAQTHPDVEHVVVDGASKDGTIELVRREATPLMRIVSEPDRGIYDAMNKGIALASGDVIGILNSDDVFAGPEVLGRVAEAFERSGADMVHGDLVYVAREDTERVLRRWASGPFVPGSFRHGWHPPHPALYLTRGAYEAVGPYRLDFRIASDFDFMLRAFECVGLQSNYVPETLVRMRAGGASNRSSAILPQNREVLRSFRDNRVPVEPVSYLFGRFGAKLRQYFGA